MKFLTTLVLLAIFSSQAIAAPIPKAVPSDPFKQVYTGIHLNVDCEVYFLYDDGYHKTGLKKDDKIVRIGTTPFEKSWEIWDIMKQYRPGAIVEIEVIRDKKNVVLKVKLVPAWERSSDAD